jgi:hypothetical protein
MVYLLVCLHFVFLHLKNIKLNENLRLTKEKLILNEYFNLKPY